MNQFKLIEKKLIADNVFKLIYSSEQKLSMKPGQFITFILDKIGGRAYSILELNGNKVKLIIKRWSAEMGGRGGSMLLCDAEIGETFKGVGPAGHFILQENNKNKLFLGTGTGFPPLYNQILTAINFDCNLKLVFGVRSTKDLFYLDELNKLKQKNKNFDFEIFLSCEYSEEYNRGYITKFLTQKNIKKFEEFYICGAPVVIDSCYKELEKVGVSDHTIFSEKY